jgi:integrase
VAAQSLEVLDMVNRINYKLAKEYLKYLDEVAQLDRGSIQRYWFYLKPLLIWADESAFNDVSSIRPTFSSHLANARLDGEAGTLAPATLKKIIQTTKRFFTWLKLNYPHEFRGLPQSWIEALQVPRHSQPAAKHVFVTLEEVRQIAALKIDENDLALQRDQAAAVLLFVSGMRAGAFSTLPIRAVNLDQRTIQQLPALGVETKNGKSATTYLLDIPDLLVIVSKWDAFIRARLPSTAMWFTPSIGHWGEQTLSADRPGMNRNVAVAKRLRIVFRLAQLPYKSPHKFRHGHAVYALQHAKTMADYKAVSMNLMHTDIRVTDGIYAPLAGNEVQQRIAGLTNSVVTLSADTTDVNALVQGLSKGQLPAALIAIAQQLARS